MFASSPLDDRAITTVCQDYSLFKRTLQQSRILEDNIIPRLNGLTTRQPNFRESCQRFEDTLQAAYRSRERLIAECLRVRDERISKNRAKLGPYSPEDDSDLSNEIAHDEGQRRAIEREFTVEEILRSRTSNVFKTRCADSTIIKDFWDVRRDAKPVSESS
ncbi:uncharacterized protein EV422DRAFT_197097 [Fimicolochytrium jonesii]|uniref:uncharacterized protein n=1 Tax=Fimicolochytrium jonesii TaxID=1396493 RepID=UPI0022FDB510|nr:uncharacterized protein EV422DRAFT_197097 [Fimicolochytrium jonesii]KAI8817908.1 hypothetical protein EV422DRAFT_197097 [Fimicolochytrium jonesii]